MRDKPVLLIILTFRMGVASELADAAGFELARHPLPRLKCYDSMPTLTDFDGSVNWYPHSTSRTNVQLTRLIAHYS
jgi:hypothetical protein